MTSLNSIDFFMQRNHVIWTHLLHVSQQTALWCFATVSQQTRQEIQVLLEDIILEKIIQKRFTST